MYAICNWMGGLHGCPFFFYICGMSVFEMITVTVGYEPLGAILAFMVTASIALIWCLLREYGFQGDAMKLVAACAAVGIAGTMLWAFGVPTYNEYLVLDYETKCGKLVKEWEACGSGVRSAMYCEVHKS